MWATGNGGLTDDDCNCDGYTTSIYTISVGCIGDHGLSAYYTELCSSTLGVTFNGGSHREKEENKMVSTNLFVVPRSEHSFILHRKITRRNKSLEREREKESMYGAVAAALASHHVMWPESCTIAVISGLRLFLVLACRASFWVLCFSKMPKKPTLANVNSIWIKGIEKSLSRDSYLRTYSL